MNASEVQKSWEYLGAVEEEAVEDARLQLQHAFRLVGDVTLRVTSLEDHPGQMEVQWWPNTRALASGTVGGNPPIRVALGLADCSLLVATDTGEIRERLVLDGKTRADAVAWLRNELDACGADGSGLVATPAADIPGHPVAEGAAFSCSDSEGFAEVARYYADAWRSLCFARGLGTNASPIRIGPQHLTLHTSIDLYDGGGAPTTVEVSFRPADDDCDDFHFCMMPNVTPSIGEDELGELEGGGEWHSDGWFGSLLRMSESRFYDAEPMQADAVTMYLDSTVDELLAALRED